MFELAFGFAASALIAAAAWKYRSLTGHGAFAATVLGTVLIGFGGWQWGALLGVFFFSATALSRFREGAKRKVAEEKFSKGNRRDAFQVLANGGLGGLLALAQAVFPDSGWPLAAYVGTVATVNADTWATELGVLSRSPPRHILTWEKVETGASGGLSLLGLAASLAGAFLIGISAMLLWTPEGTGQWRTWEWRWLPLAVCSGVAGSLWDSLLGATVQVVYADAGTGRETEKPVDAGGRANAYLRGIPFIGNDAVNFLAALAGAAAAAALYAFR